MVEELDNRISIDQTILPKYHAASLACSSVMERLIQMCKSGARVAEICVFGDDTMENELEDAMRRLNINPKNIQKGAARPTCLNVNQIIANFSPVLANESTLNEGDVVKIDIGAHVDGYICVCSATTIVTDKNAEPVRGPIADVTCASYLLSKILSENIAVGTQSESLVSLIAKVCDSFHVKPLNGQLVALQKRYVPMESSKLITCEDGELIDSGFTVDEDDVFVLNIALSSKSSTFKEMTIRPMVAQRNAHQNSRGLKLKSSKDVFNVVDRRFSIFPFSLRNFDDAKSKLGLHECFQRDLLRFSPVYSAHNDQHVARFSQTVVASPEPQQILLSSLVPETLVPYVHSEFSLPQSFKLLGAADSGMEIDQ